MGNSDEYRLVGNNHFHDGERKMEGDVFVPTESELNRFPYKFEPVEDSDESEEDDSDEESDEGNRGEDSSTAESEESESFDPSDYTLSELEGELEDADLDASTDELHDRESEGKDRTGAHKIIEAVVGE